jgi:hypothetical protein
MRQGNTFITAPILLGFLAFAASSTAPNRALADGTEVVAAIAPDAPPPPPPDSSSAPPVSRRNTQMVAFTLAGVAVAGAGAGIAFGVLALNDKSSFDAHPTYHAASSASENAVLSDVCLGGGVIAAVTSVILFVRAYQTSPEAAASSHTPLVAPASKGSSSVSLTLTPLITVHGGGAGAALRF